MSVTFEQGEDIVVEVRKHWIVLITHIVAAIILALIPFVLKFIIEAAGVTFSPAEKFDDLFLFLYMIWILIIWIYLFYAWTDYYLDIWIITNKKILVVEQFGFFNRKVSTLTFVKVQNVSSEVNGLIATFLGFGELQVETAGHDQDFIVKYINKPNETRQKINDALDRFHNTLGYNVAEE